MFEPKESVFGKMRNVLRSDKEKQEMAKEREARVERERKEWQEIELDNGNVGWISRDAVEGV